MNRHTTTGQWKLGLALASTTMVAWATLAPALKIALEVLDPMTQTWVRFLIAGVISAVFLLSHKKYRGELFKLNKSMWGLMLLASVMLIGNYVLYLMGLEKTTPANAQVIIQLAPALLALGGIMLFHEKYNRWQWLGFFTLLSGLLLFFKNQLAVMVDNISSYQTGILLILGASIVWAIYALAQKQLLRDISSVSAMTFMYIFATIVLLPASEPATLLELDSLHWWVVGFCAINTLIAYGAFAEAMDHWEASRVSAIVSLTPLGTILTAAIIHYYWPQLMAAEKIDLVGWIGTFMVICGSVLTAVAGDNQQKSAGFPANQTTGNTREH